jgi:hypothetical protein
MSYDLRILPPPGLVLDQDFLEREVGNEMRWFEVEGNTVRYCNPDTGFGFNCALRQGDTKIRDLPFAGPHIESSLNYVLPEWCGDEFADIISVAFSRLDMTLFDPQRDGAQAIELTYRGIFEGWAAANRQAMAILDLGHRPGLPKARNTAVHDWNMGLCGLAWDCEARGFDLYAPPVALVALRNIHGVQTMIEWVVGNGQIVPEDADYLLLLGGAPERSRLMRQSLPALDAPFAAVPKQVIRDLGLLRRKRVGNRELDLLGGGDSAKAPSVRRLIEWACGNAIEIERRFDPTDVLDSEDILATPTGSAVAP